MTAREQRLRVLIVRLGAMGDILHAMPAVASLRRTHPEWFLGWAVEPRWLPLLRGSDGDMPLVDQIHLVNAKSWAHAPLSPRTFGEIARLRRELRAGQYDVAVDLQGAVRSAWVGRMARAPRMIGEANPREKPAKWLFRERIPTSGAHVIEQAVEVCQAIAGDKLLPAQPVLPRDAVADAWAKQLLGRSEGNLKAETPQPVVILSPGAGWGAKCWPAERYGKLAAMLHGAGCRVLVNTGPRESSLAAEVVRSSGGVALAPEFSIERLIATLCDANLLIAGDSGPLHLACALGKPVVGIFGPTDPRRNGPYGVPFRVLRHPESKRDHARRVEPEAGLLTILPQQVFAAARELLGCAP